MTMNIVALLYFAALSFGTALSDNLSGAALRAFISTAVMIAVTTVLG